MYLGTKENQNRRPKKHTKKNSKKILSFLNSFFAAQKNTKEKMSKSDALATKEMPFRVYMGYDSHEDITFEVRRRGLLVSEEEHHHHQQQNDE